MRGVAFDDEFTMKKIGWRVSLFLRLTEWWDEPSSKVTVGLLVALLIIVGLFALGSEPKPLASRFGLGPGWGPRWDCWTGCTQPHKTSK
jgi:hypothetical protein